MAVLTDAHNGNALARLRKVDLVPFFDYIISFDMTGCKKPAPDSVFIGVETFTDFTYGDATCW
jgi:beta-phosphoglucomutase-like phosphatase (HAD superfamily)